MAGPLEVEQQLFEDLSAITDEQTRVLVAAWAVAWSEVSADLLDTVEDILAGGTRITSAVVVRSVRLQQALAAIADKLDDLTADAGVTITSDLAAVVDQATAGTSQLMAAQVTPARAALLDLARRPPARQLDAIVTRFIDRVTAATLPLAEETYDVLQRELVRGIAVGDNPRETARRMVARAEDHFNFGLTRALTLSRTETVDAYREAARIAQDEHADVLAGWVWLAHLTSRTCRSCVSMHGRMFGLEVPGPHDHQQGRCSRTPVVAEDDGSVDLSWVPDADEHFEALSEDEQVALLGRRGYRAWVNGEFPREEWTKTRSSDGWRDAQVPASPGDAGAGAGNPPRNSASPAAAGDDRPHREAAIERLGAPPAETPRAESLTYWEQRQNLLPVDFRGDVLKSHEIETVERFLDAGEQLLWIPKDRSLPTNDFVWTTLPGRPLVEMKSTKARYETIHGRIVDAASRAFLSHGVRKENFLIDLGDQDLPEDLVARLEAFNVGRTKYRLARLWLMSRGEIQEITLLP